MKIISSLAIAFTALAAAAPCNAEPNLLAGKAFAQANCSHCHSIDKFTPSSLAIAPPFRTLHERYPVESLEEALAEGITTGHPIRYDRRRSVQRPDRIGFNTNAEAIAHCGILAEHFYRDSLVDDQDLEISVVNASGREIHREFVHRN